MAENQASKHSGDAQSANSTSNRTDESRTFAAMRMDLEQKKIDRHQRVDEEKKELAERSSEKGRKHDVEIAKRWEEFEAYKTEREGSIRDAGIKIAELEEKLTNATLDLATERERVAEAEKHYEGSKGTVKKLRDQMKANRVQYDETLVAMEKRLKDVLEAGVQNVYGDGVGERETLISDKDKLVDEIKVLRKRCESKTKKLADAKDRLAHKKTRKDECLKERKSEYDQVISSMQERCDREVKVMRERMEEEKEALRKELHRQNDLNCIKSDEQMRLLVEGHKEVVSHHSQEMAALRCTLQAEKERSAADMREMAEGHREELGAKAAEYQQETSTLKDEMAALRLTFDNERANLEKSLTELITKHCKSEKDLEKYHKEKEEKLREEVDSLKRQLSEKIRENELLQC